MAKPMTAADRLEAARAGLEATNKHLAELASRRDDALRRDDHRTASKLLGEIEEQRLRDCSPSSWLPAETTYSSAASNHSGSPW